MAQTFFLVTDDETRRSPENFHFRDNCGSALHKFTLQFTEAQTVYMSAHTWPLRSYPRDCLKDESDKFVGAGAATHYFIFKEKNAKRKTWLSDFTWF